MLQPAQRPPTSTARSYQAMSDRELARAIAALDPTRSAPAQASSHAAASVQEAAQGCLHIPVETEAGVGADMAGWVAHFNDSDPRLGIYVPGFGFGQSQQQAGPVDVCLAQRAENPQNGYGSLAKIGLSTLTSQVSQLGFATEAALLLQGLEAMLERDLEGDQVPPIRLIGYSEGSTTAISLAHLIQERDQRSWPGKHQLLLLSPGGVGDCPSPLGTAGQFAAESLKIAGQDPGTQNTLGGILGKALSQRHLSQAWSNLAQGQIGAGLAELGQGVEQTQRHLEKILRRNPDADRLDESWQVALRIPAGDSLFDLEAIAHSLKPGKSFPAAVTDHAFGRAQVTEVTLIGNEEAHHAHPKENPWLYLG